MDLQESGRLGGPLLFGAVCCVREVGEWSAAEGGLRLFSFF